MSDEKTVLVTGATGGIGQEICRRLAADGWSIGIHYGRNEEAASDLARVLTESGGKAVPLQADFRDPSTVEGLFERFLEQFGQLNGYVSCAAIPGNDLVQRWSPERMNEVLNINLLSGVHGLHQAAKHIEKNGRIVQLSTGLVGRPMPTTGLMTGSKAALEGIVQVLSREIGPKRVTVNAVRPGATSPGMFDHHGEPERKKFAQMSVFRRLGTPEDIAGVVRFLLSDEAGWITGETITVDGGAFG